MILLLPAGEVLLAHAERHTVLATGDAPALLCVLDNRHHGDDYDLPEFFGIQSKVVSVNHSIWLLLTVEPYSPLSTRT